MLLAFFHPWHSFSLLCRSDPQAHSVYPLTKELCRKVAMRFLRPEILKSLTVENVKNEDNYLPISEMHVGLLTLSTLNKLTNDGSITQSQRKKLLTAAQAFYRESLVYVLEKMDANNEFWMHAVWVNFLKRNEASWEDVNYFIVKYHSLLGLSSTQYDRLYEEFIDFKSIEDDEIDLEEAVHCIYDDGTKEYRMDTIWYILQSLKSPVGNHYRFRLLFEVAKIVLLTPHSNASIERVYSLVNKNKRAGSERNRLDIDGSLSSILAVKLDKPESDFKCYEFKPSNELLLSAKTATRRYNKEHSSTSASSSDT